MCHKDLHALGSLPIEKTLTALEALQHQFPSLQDENHPFSTPRLCASALIYWYVPSFIGSNNIVFPPSLFFPCIALAHSLSGRILNYELNHHGHGLRRSAAGGGKGHSFNRYPKSGGHKGRGHKY